MTTQTTQWIADTGAQWIWPADTTGSVNQYVQMVHDFEWKANSGKHPRLLISADTNYIAWINGKLAGFGQWSDYPDDKTHNLLDVISKVGPGTNRLCILAWYQGQSTSQYRKGAPGVLYALVGEGGVAAVSGRSTQMRVAPDYVSGPVPRVSPQLSFTFEFHADKDDGWRQKGHRLDATWRVAITADMKPYSSRAVRDRPVKTTPLGKRLPMRVVEQGEFVRKDPTLRPAVAIQTDELTSRAANELFENPASVLLDDGALRLAPRKWNAGSGAYVVLDAEREECGLLELEIDAPEGTILDIGYGEHLEDGRVRASVGPRNFASRYVCGAGRRKFLHPFLRIAGRYVQVHITPHSTTEPIVLHYAGIRPTDYPVIQAGKFECANKLHNRIWDVSKRTLHLCIHEHYEDCPWREQALYAMDARNQALAGYYCFGNYHFARASIDLLGKGMADDGWLELCAPAEIPITIPSFSLAWILMLDDYLMYSGDRDFVRTQLPTARRILETCTRESSGPILRTPHGNRMWNFYEWAPGLDGEGRGKETPSHYDAPLTLFYLLALDAMVRMSTECLASPNEFASMAADVRAEFANTFWDAGERAVVTRVGDKIKPHFAELTQALAILARVVPDNELPSLRERLAKDKNGWVPCTISHTLYKFEALLTDREQFASRVLELIARDWDYMLSQGATSFWETIDGAKAFANAGSLCHGWSGIPAYFYGAYLLGVKPTTPGFAKYDVAPLPGELESASGDVPTPGRILHVNWDLREGKMRKRVSEELVKGHE